MATETLPATMFGPSATLSSTFDQRWRSLAPRGIRPGLQALQEVLQALGSPHLDVSSVLIGGTNGKGSTASLLASMAEAAGYRVGLFTSPFLQTPEEQIRIGAVSISLSRLIELWDEVVDIAERLHPERMTPFEALTATAVLHFAREDVDLVVCEVGMGGRLDSTNVLDPAVSAITSLGLDHAAFLGNTLQQVAAHKAGIFRRGRPALLAPCLDPEAEALLEDNARALGAVVTRTRQDTRIHQVHLEVDGSQKVEIQTPESTYSLHLPLAGAHQHSNLITAVRIAETLRNQGWHRLGVEAVTQGTAACRWPGRLEYLHVEGQDILLDAAHNVQGVKALVEHLETRGSTFDVLFGALGDKDVSAMLAALRGARRLWLTQPDSDRAWDAEAWKPRIDHPNLHGPWSVADALQRSRVGRDATLLVVTGSLRLVGDVRQLLLNHDDNADLTLNLDGTRP